MLLKEDMAMRTYDFAPLTRSSIGFDRLFDLINSNAQQLNGQETHFPPYDIVRIDDDTYRITLAVAGFSPEEISITAQQNLLAVAGQRKDAREHDYLHRGIAAHSFDKQFNLADHVEVTGASFDNGLLQIELVRKIPEAMKPRRVPISGSKLTKDGGGKAA
jgi:molecular chaperone IbpA